MSWIEHHADSERLASRAQVASRQGRQRQALALYAKAADAEELAIADLDIAKVRTLGISAVSAVSLYYKAAKFERAEEVAARCLGFSTLPAFAREQLRNLLQSIWSEQTRENADVQFAQGQVLVSVQGGEVVLGGAPLDLIMDKVKTVQSLFHRTAEFLSGREHRRRGAPSQDIQDSCRPWLFQTAPGSYQFAVAIQKEYQQNFLKPVPSPEDVAACFLRILRVEIQDPEESLAEVVPNSDYRSTFLKLTRNLAPDGESCSRLDVQAVGDPLPISLGLAVREDLGRVIRKTKRGPDAAGSQTESLRGMLRAVHLDSDWLELAAGDQRLRVIAVGEEVDDVIGPLVNRQVIVHVSIVGGKRRFLDIEADDSQR